MSGLLALLDDVAALAKLAAASLDDIGAQAVKAGSKAAGVVIDDAAVTPRYVTGLAAKRELPIIGRIALGSLKNKLLILLPAALLLSTFLPSAITPLLMFGALFLCFEGYEKVHHLVAGDDGSHGSAATAGAVDAKALEDEKVTSAIRTDFILSAEIMAIALAEIVAPDIATKAIVLAAVAILITGAVYGVVALIVKADDFGVYLAQRPSAVVQAIGRGLVRGMPKFLSVLSFIGMLAMLWVGGEILVHGLAHYGITAPEHIIHGAAESVAAAVPVATGVFVWLTKALGSGIIGLIAGAITAVLVSVFVTPFLKTKAPSH